MSDETPRGKSLANLRPATPGCEGRNQTGNNGWTMRRQELMRFLRDKSADNNRARIEQVLIATYTSSLVPGKDGEGDRRLIWEYYFGKMKPIGDVVRVPDHADGSTLDLILATYRERLLAGELSEGDLSTLAALLMAAEKTEAEIIAKILGDRKGTSSALKERAEEVMRRLEARTAEAATASETPTPEATVPATEEKSCP